MSETLLAEIGRALYGARFSFALARDLGVSDRTMRRWLSGETAPPPGIWAECAELLATRKRDIDRVMQGLSGAHPKKPRNNLAFSRV